MEEELRGLLMAHRDEIVGIGGMRVQSDRKDAYCRIVRDCLQRSSLCLIGGELHYFDGRAYVPTARGAVVSAVLNILSDDMGVGASDLCRLGDIPYTVLDRKVVNADGRYVAFDNCLYDVETGKVCAFDSSHHCVCRFHYAYDSKGKCERWKSFLEEVLPDEGARMALQEFFGLCFIDRGRYSIEKFALLVGAGSNGKSVICEVVKAVLGGDGLVDNLSPDQLQDAKQVISLNGKLLNIAPDVRKGASFDSCLKALSSAQVVKGWAMYKGSQEVKCPPLAFALNELPVFRDVTYGFFRRILLFSFGVTIPEERQDRTLTATLIANERSGIFRWIMEGRKRLMANGGMFTMSPAMLSAQKMLEGRVRTEQSPVLQYLETEGFSVSPLFEGQRPVRVSANSIYDALGGAVTKYNITHELRRYGVHVERGREVKYLLYMIQYE